MYYIIIVQREHSYLDLGPSTILILDDQEEAKQVMKETSPPRTMIQTSNLILRLSLTELATED